MYPYDTELIPYHQVDQSEMAWRLLSRRLGAHLCYTPMIHSRILLESCGRLQKNQNGIAPVDGTCMSETNLASYRDEFFIFNDQDRPLIAQFCGNDPRILADAAKLVAEMGGVDAVDLNLGCPQGIAKRGHYGSFLQDEWELVHDLISTLHQELNVPVTAKIRVFSDVNRTIEYAKMIERAGAQVITVHGRLREQKGTLTGYADWDQIKAVKENVSVPVFANGNILYHADIQRCLDYTGCDAVMVAETNLYNPALFAPSLFKVKDSWPFFLNTERFKTTEFSAMLREYDSRLDIIESLIEHPPAHCLALEFLDECEKIKSDPKTAGCLRSSSMKGHLFKLFHLVLQEDAFTAYRGRLGKCHNVEMMREVIDELSLKLEVELVAQWKTNTDLVNHQFPPDIMLLSDGGQVWSDKTEQGTDVWKCKYRTLPYWVCKPYIRPEDVNHIKKEESAAVAESTSLPTADQLKMEELKKRQAQERKELKELKRQRKQAAKVLPKFKLCACRLPASTSCQLQRCKNCCRDYLGAFVRPFFVQRPTTDENQAQECVDFELSADFPLDKYRSEFCCPEHIPRPWLKAIKALEAKLDVQK